MLMAAGSPVRRRTPSYHCRLMLPVRPHLQTRRAWLPVIDDALVLFGTLVLCLGVLCC